MSQMVEVRELIFDGDQYSKNMTFVYEKTHKFREQETGHAYFDTRKGETRELLFEGNVSFGYSGCDGQHQHAPLDGLIITNVEADYLVVDFAGKENILYKILAADVKPELDEDHIDRIPYVFGPVDGTHVTYMDYSEGVYHDIYKTEDEYPLCAVVPYSPYGGSELPQILAPDSAIEGQPSIKIYAVTGVSNDESQFSEFAKNVFVKAHTEYTAHINGKIGESTGGLNGIILKADSGLQTITGATWEEARDAYVADKTVLLRQENKAGYNWHSCIGYDSANNKLSFGSIYWFSDGRIEVER